MTFPSFLSSVETLAYAVARAAAIAFCRRGRRGRRRVRRPSIVTAINYASSVIDLKHFEEAKSLMRKTVPVARRVLGESNAITLKTWWNYAKALYKDSDATLDDLREAVTTLEETGRTARRVLGGDHPVVSKMEASLRRAQAALRARETPSSARKDKN